MLDEVLGRSGEDVEIEDLVGAEILLENVSAALGAVPELRDDERAVGSLPDRVQLAAARQSLPMRTVTASVALNFVAALAEGRKLPKESVLDRFELLFQKVGTAFEDGAGLPGME